VLLRMSEAAREQLIPCPNEPFGPDVVHVQVGTLLGLGDLVDLDWGHLVEVLGVELLLLLLVELALVPHPVRAHELLSVHDEEPLGLSEPLVKMDFLLIDATAHCTPDSTKIGVDPFLMNIVVVSSLLDVSEMKLDLAKEQNHITDYYLDKDRDRIDWGDHQQEVEDNKSQTADCLGYLSKVKYSNPGKRLEIPCYE
jgi:hypothetical protein